MLTQALESAVCVRGEVVRHRIAPTHELAGGDRPLESGTSPQSVREYLGEARVEHVHVTTSAVCADRYCQ
ncbi:hypothetical protein ADL00_30020 [Streptomyces sp. AS58]|nr:hypothetical protein ADL00_30020 [Streptomyces sp. AS58]